MKQCGKCGAYLDAGEKCDCEGCEVVVAVADDTPKKLVQKPKKRRRPYRYGHRS